MQVAPQKAPAGAATSLVIDANHFTDARDSQVYKFVKIGSQTWMAENLDYKTGNSWCYENDPDNCEKYGRLYDWQTAMTACPEGWHLPSDDEWSVLEKAVGGKETGGTKLKSANGWARGLTSSSYGNGIDAYGFTVLPAGYCYGDEAFGELGGDAYFWSSSESSQCASGDSSEVWSRMRKFYSCSRVFNLGRSDAFHSYAYRSRGYSLRCINNSPLKVNSISHP